MGRSWAGIVSSSISDRFFDGFWSPKRCPKGGFLGAKMEPKSIPKRGRNLRAKKLSLGSGLGRSWVDLGPLRYPKSCSRQHGGHFFKIHMFRLFGPPRAIFDPKMSKNDRAFSQLDYLAVILQIRGPAVGGRGVARLEVLTEGYTVRNRFRSMIYKQIDVEHVSHGRRHPPKGGKRPD